MLLDSNNTVRFDGNSIHNDGGNSTNDVNPVGIFALDFTTGKKYHDTTGTSGGGKYEMLLPVVEATDLHDNADVLMFNIYSHNQRVSAIDYAFDCIELNTTSSPLQCTAITEIINLVQDFPDKIPSSLTLMPIVPCDNPNHVVGLVSAVHNWDKVLNLASNEKVDGIMVVISDGQSSHSFVYEKGQAIYMGNQDSHTSHYENQRVSFIATSFGGPEVYN